VNPRRLIGAWDEVAESPDDAPLWAEVLGMVFAPALFVRAGVHVWVAWLAGVDPRLAAGHDLTVQSPIRGLRGDRHDAVARLGTLGVGVFAVSAWSPQFALAIWPTPVAVWVLGQVAVVCADPALYILSIARSTVATPEQHAR